MRKFYLLILTIIFEFFISGNAFSNNQIKIRLAILNFSSTNIKNSPAEGIRDMVEVELYKTGLFEILERNQFDLILKEKGYENNRCKDPGCAVKIGKVISADKVIIGSVNNIGGINITIKFVDIKTGIVEYADIEKSKDDTGIIDSVHKLSEKISMKFAGTENKNAKLKSNQTDYSYPTYYSLGIIPGLGQLYAGKKTKAYLFLGGFVSLAGFSGYAIYDFNKKRKAYEDLKSGTSEDYETKYKASGNALNLVKVSFGILGAFYLYNWVDIIFFNNPIAEEQVPENKLNSLTFNINRQNYYNSYSLPSEIIYNIGLIHRF